MMTIITVPFFGEEDFQTDKERLKNYITDAKVNPVLKAKCFLCVNSDPNDIDQNVVEVVKYFMLFTGTITITNEVTQENWNSL